MKQSILAVALAIGTLTSQAQDFKTVLDKTFTAFDTTQSQDVRIEQSNKLGLIAKKWDNEWSAHYYVALSKVTLNYFEPDAAKRDAYLDEAEKEREEAVALLKKESDDTYVLAAMIANSRIGIDPMNRWQKYGQVFQQNLESAKELNPDNPRMYYVKGTSTFFTPKQFGGGKKSALPYFEKAKGLFPKEEGKDITQPHWGKRQTEYFIGECNKEDKG
jgi:hypothetical protein